MHTHNFLCKKEGKMKKTHIICFFFFLQKEMQKVRTRMDCLVTAVEAERSEKDGEGCKI